MNYLKNSGGMEFKRSIVIFIETIVHFIDIKINRLINRILHHNFFQKLEASWRGLYYLTHLDLDRENTSFIKIKVLSVSWNEFKKDLYQSAEFDQSQLFVKIYSHEFDQPGGEPFGLLIGDYNISRLSGPKSDIVALRSAAKISAAAFAPFITGLAPDFFDLEDFAQLEHPLDLLRIFQQPSYREWNLLRQDEATCFIALVLPEILCRPPYKMQENEVFQENITRLCEYLWGNPIYYLAGDLLRTFHHTGWFNEIPDLSNDKSTGYSLDPYPIFFRTDCTFQAKKPLVKISFTDKQEKLLSQFGFIPLCVSEKNHRLIFYEWPTIHKADLSKQNLKNVNRGQSMLRAILCASRFAHYLKVIARNKIGSFLRPKECEEFLQNWLLQYAAAGSGFSDELAAKYPLRQGKVMISEQKGKIGCWLCTLHLTLNQPVERVEAHLHFKSELTYVS